MNSKRNWMIYGTLLIGVAVASLWFLAQEEELAQPVRRELMVGNEERVPLAVSEKEREAVVSEVSEPEPFEWPEGMVPNELVFGFRNRSELEAFLRDARRAGFAEIESIPALNLVRLRVRDEDEMSRARELAGEANIGFNPVVAAPDVPELDGVAASFLPFGDQALPWLGVPDDNKNWGEGVRIAVLDTGVSDHPLLANASITHMSVLEGGAGADVGSHGTGVAALIAGQGDIRGIAPGAELLSIQVLDGNGVGDGFHLAMGIIAAVDAGADIINLSLGTGTPSSILWDAVQYGQQRDVTFVAAGGNDGGGQLLYPAAYPGVVAVGAIDGNGQHVSFSNRGEGLSVVAPGLGIYTAGADDSIVQINGTSFASPLVAGALAHLLTTERPGEAVRILQEYANDGGHPGYDGVYGHGAIDLERVEWRNVPWVHDLAVADHVLNLSGEDPQVLVTVENRGTARAGNIFLEVLVGDREYRMPMESLGPGEVGHRSIPIGDLLRDLDEIGIVSRVHVPGMDDVRPDNDLKAGQIRIRLPDQNDPADR